MKNVVILTTHKLNDAIRLQILKLNEEVTDSAHLVVLYQGDYGAMDFPDGIRTYSYTVETLNNLGYNPIAETIVPGSNHFPLLQFYKDNMQYDYYWNIEYDVRFNGDWRTFFSFFEAKDDDFITSHIETLSEHPSWPHWDKMELNDTYIPLNEYIRSFNPIYRISCRALDFLDNFLSRKNSGHHEILIPTVLKHYGFKVADMGGKGSFIYKGMPDLFYTDDSAFQSTMRYRPVYSECDMQISDKLYHPVK